VFRFVKFRLVPQGDGNYALEAVYHSDGKSKDDKATLIINGSVHLPITIPVKRTGEITQLLYIGKISSIKFYSEYFRVCAVVQNGEIKYTSCGSEKVPPKEEVHVTIESWEIVTKYHSGGCTVQLNVYSTGNIRVKVTDNGTELLSTELSEGMNTIYIDLSTGQHKVCIVGAANTPCVTIDTENIVKPYWPQEKQEIPVDLILFGAAVVVAVAVGYLLMRRD